MPTKAEWIVLAACGLISAAACAFLLDSWWSWTAGPWADCPNYAFGKSWYPEPPIIVTFVPCATALLMTAVFSALFGRFRRERRRFAMFVAIVGVTVATLPLLAVIVLPLISNALGMTTAGC